MKLLERLGAILLLLGGVACILWPENVASWLPWMLGGLMVLSGGVRTLAYFRERRYLQPGQETATGLIVLLVGIAVLVGQEKSLALMGVMWGIMGLGEGGGEIGRLLARRCRGERWKGQMAIAALKLLLALLLLIEPVAHFRTHIALLGMEIILLSVRGESVVDFLRGMKMTRAKQSEKL